MKTQWIQTALFSGASLAALALAMPASAQDPTLDSLRQQINTLQQRIDQLEAEQERQAKAQENLEEKAVASGVSSGNDKVRLELSGQVNRGILFGDNGDQSDVFFVDNDNSSTRFRLIGEADISEDVTIGSQIEVQMESNSTASVDFDQDNSTGDFFSERKLEVYADSKQLGRIWLGQGDTASNGTSEVDLSGTTVVAYSGIVDMAGGLSFSDGNDATVDPRINQAMSNLDGLSRQDRIRYDTPSLSGFKLSTSAGSGGIWDVAVRWGGDFDGYRANAALAYAKPDTADGQINGSASFRAPNGVSLTLAAGQQDADDRDPMFYYGKLAWEFDATSFGSTAIAIDYFQSEDIFSGNSDFSAGGDEGRAYGAFIVQNIDVAATELYFGVRNHELDKNDGEFDDVLAVLGGARVKF